MDEVNKNPEKMIKNSKNPQVSKEILNEEIFKTSTTQTQIGNNYYINNNFYSSNVSNNNENEEKKDKEKAEKKEICKKCEQDLHQVREN